MAAETKKFAPGDPIFKEGEPSKCMYVIKTGAVVIQKKKLQAQIEIARLHAGEVLGELAFFDRRPRSATAIALTEVELLEIDFDSLDKIYAKVPDYIKTIMAAVAERLRKATDTIKRLEDAKDSVEFASTSAADAPAEEKT